MSGADIRPILETSPVIPVVTIEPGVDAVALARALIAGGISIIEVTLRTPSALEAIRDIGEAMPEMCLGAGTVWSASQAKAAVDAGARFLVSPGISDETFDASRDLDVAILPGAQTPSEVAHWVRRGLTAVKFFPAEPAGGVAALKALAAVFPELQFCPTGGISVDSAADYLALKAVPCVGGSWLTPAKALAAGDFAAVTKLALQAHERFAS